MADFDLFQERTISGKGVLRVPSELTKRRAVVLYSDVIRLPKSPYFNFNYEPRRTKLGFLTFLRNGYVVAQDTIDYEKQSWDAVPDITAQNLIAIKCLYKGVLQTFTNLATAQGLGVISVIDLIKDYEYLDLMWDEVRVNCYADTALKLRLYALANDKCQDDADKPKKPPKPPAPPPQVPPGTPVEVDEPYEDEENPDNTTEPYEGDDFPPQPGGETCVKYNVTWAVYDSLLQRFQNGTVTVWGEIDDAYITTNPSTMDRPSYFGDDIQFCIVCRGYADGNAPCQTSLAPIRLHGQVLPTTQFSQESISIALAP